MRPTLPLLALCSFGLIVPMAFYAAWLAEVWHTATAGCLVVALLSGMIAILAATRFEWRAHPWLIWWCLIIVVGICLQMALDLLHDVGRLSWWRASERCLGLAAAIGVACLGGGRGWKAVCVLGCAAAAGLIAIAAYALPDPTQTAITWFGYGNYNKTMHYTGAPMLAAAIALILAGRPRSLRSWATPLLVLVGLAVFAWIAVTFQRRGAMLIPFAVGCGIACDTLWRLASPRLRIGGTIAIGAIILVMSILLWQHFSEGPRGDRWQFYQAAAARIAESPWTGHGAYGALTLADSGSDWVRSLISQPAHMNSAHCEPLDILLDGGAVAGVLAASCIVLPFIAAHRVRCRRMRWPVLALLYGLVPGFLVDNSFSRVEGMVLLGIACGFAWRQERTAVAATTLALLRLMAALAGITAIACAAWMLPMATMHADASIGVRLRVLRNTPMPEQAAMLLGWMNNQIQSKVSIEQLASAVSPGMHTERFRYTHIRALATCAYAKKVPMTDQERIRRIAASERLLPMFPPDPQAMDWVVVNMPRLIAGMPEDVQRRLALRRLGGGVDPANVQDYDTCVDAVCLLRGKVARRDPLAAADWELVESLMHHWHTHPQVCRLLVAMVACGGSAPPPSIEPLLVQAARYEWQIEDVGWVADPLAAGMLFRALAADGLRKAVAEHRHFAVPAIEQVEARQVILLRLWGASRQPAPPP